jgi:hypothetical protein
MRQPAKAAAAILIWASMAGSGAAAMTVNSDERHDRFLAVHASTEIEELASPRSIEPLTIASGRGWHHSKRYHKRGHGHRYHHRYDNKHRRYHHGYHHRRYPHGYRYRGNRSYDHGYRRYDRGYRYRFHYDSRSRHRGHGLYYYWRFDRH